MQSISLVSLDPNSPLCTYSRFSKCHQRDDESVLSECTNSSFETESSFRFELEMIVDASKWDPETACRFETASSSYGTLPEIDIPAPITISSGMIPPPAEVSFDSPDSPLSSVGSESEFDQWSCYDVEEDPCPSERGMYVVKQGKLVFVPDVCRTDPDFNVCWDFNTKYGCSFPGCAWKHQPCSTTKAHPTKIGVVCDPRFGRDNMKKNTDLEDEQTAKLKEMGLL